MGTLPVTVALRPVARVPLDQRSQLLRARSDSEKESYDNVKIPSADRNPYGVGGQLGDATGMGKRQ